MALTLDHLDDENICVIAEADGALDNVTKAEYKQYLKTNDETLLRFKEGQQPTRFFLRKVISFKRSQKLQNASYTATRSGRMAFQAGSMAEEVREVLVGIEHPPGTKTSLVFEKDGVTGLATDKVMQKLVAAGVITDLYVARKNYLESRKATSDEIKKS